MTITNNAVSKLIVALVAAAMLFTLSFAPVAKAAATDADLQAQITALMSQISALQTQPGMSTAQASYTFTSNLTVGSRGEDVRQLQMFLNHNGYAVAMSGTGSAGMESTYFGPATRAALAKYQAAKGIMPATGYFGPLTRASVNGQMVSTGGTGTGPGVGTGTGTGSYPAGCTSTSGFSSTTGMPCSGAGSLPAGCTSTAGFSSTTGMSCSGSTVAYPAGCTSATGFSTTTGLSCAGGTVSSGTNGYLADISSDSSNRVSTVYESEADKVVAGFRATARLSSQKVDRVRVQMRNTDTVGSSPSLGRYITSASLWLGSQKIATLPIASADRSSSDDTYTFNFSSLNADLAKDVIGHFYVSVTANGSIDSTDATNADWAVVFPDGGVSASSPDGSYDTYNASAGNVGTLTGSNVGFKFGKFSANGVKATIGLSSSNPVASIVTVQNTAATNGVNLLKFTVKATNSGLTLRKVPIQIVSTGHNVSTMINTIKLYHGTQIVDSLDGSAGTQASTGTIATGACTLNCGFIFSNLSTPGNTIASGATAEYTVVVDLKQVSTNYSEGDTLTASLANADALLTANFGVLDANGDQLTAGSTYRVGSAVGEIQTLRINGVQVTMGTPTYTTAVRGGNTGGADVMTVTYNIPLTMTAFGQTLFTGQTATRNSTTVAATKDVVAFGFNEATAPTVRIDSNTPGQAAISAATTGPTFSCDNTPIENTVAYRLDAGVTRTCHVTVTLQSTSTAAAAATHSLRVQLINFQTFTDNALTAANSAIQTLLPIANYQTGYQVISSN